MTIEIALVLGLVVSAVILFATERLPLVLATSRDCGVSDVRLLTAITFAASDSFINPLGDQTNTLIYGPGQFRYADFLRVGTPLNILFWILATIFIPQFWPF